MVIVCFIKMYSISLPGNPRKFLNDVRSLIWNSVSWSDKPYNLCRTTVSSLS